MRAPLESRIEKSLKKGDVQAAINRLVGALEFRPLNQQLNNQLAGLYFQIGDLVKAGKYWYLKNDKGADEIKAVQEFEKSLGYDPILILRRIMANQSFATNQLSGFQLDILSVLLERIKEKGKKTPRFLLVLERRVCSKDNPKL